jgi:phage terminase large subunit GpA-like protein
MDENNMLRRGSLSLFVQPGSKTHSSFAQHIVAEELVTEFKEGKGAKTYWTVNNPNNHWLDALYYASAAGRFSGVHLLSESEGPKVTPREVIAEQKQKTKRVPHGKPQLKSRPGGWIQGIRRNR